MARSPRGPVLRAAELGLWQEAAGLLDAARAEAAAMLGQAGAVLQAERARGYAEGVEAARGEVARHLAQMSARQAASAAALEQALPDLLATCLDRLVAHFDRGELLRGVVGRALAEQSWNGRAVLRVAPDAAEAAQAAVAQDPRCASITVEVSESAASGTCVFVCPFGSIEIGVEAQLQALREGIAKGWAEGPDAR